MPPPDPLVHAMMEPAARLDGAGRVLAVNDAFRIWAGIPVLLISGHAAEVSVPGVPLLPKPFGARLLVEEVRRMRDLAEA